jgi:hypothetical protein
MEISGVPGGGVATPTARVDAVPGDDEDMSKNKMMKGPWAPFIVCGRRVRAVPT